MVSMSLLLLLCPVISALAQSSSNPSSGSSSGSSLTISSSTPSSGSPTSSGTAANSASSTSSAAFPSLSGYSTCVNNCLVASIAQIGCDSVVDVDCFCSNATSFINTLVECVTPTCPGDLASAEGVSQQFCNLASPSVSLSFSPLPSSANSTNSASSTSSSALSSSSATSSTSPSTTPTPTSSASTATSTSPSPSPSGNASQSSGAYTTYDKASCLWTAFAVGAGLLILETVLGC